MNDDYWTTFWKRHGAESTDAHPQARILRTLNKEPIAPKDWRNTIAHILDLLQLRPEDRVLDLCGGNGLIATEIAQHCREVVVVDISSALLASIAGSDADNITAITADMRTVQFDDESFNRVLCYAGLQYLSPGETVDLFRRVHSWLTARGCFVAGDIPDTQRLWDFYNTPERKSAYFDGLRSGEPIVGTWFHRHWLTALAEHSGFQSAEVLEQPDYQIYSWFRFDFRSAK